MSILCLWSPDWRTEGESTAERRTELIAVLLAEAPRVAMESRFVWVDGRGMETRHLAERLFERLTESGVEKVWGGISAVPVVAGAAARTGKQRLTVVRPGDEARFLASLPLDLLAEEGDVEDERLLGLLEGVGVRRCGDLVALSPDAIEVRFGARGTRLWKLARGDDRRVLFRPIPPERPHASIDFPDYTIRDAASLVFVLNALLDQVCDTLRGRARRARSLTLTLTLARGGRLEKVLSTSRPTADRSFWIRRLRAALERIRPGDSIAGVALEARQAEAVSARQGDLFDRGFATAAIVEEAMARLADTYPGLFVRRIGSDHPLADRRTDWEEATVEENMDSVSRTLATHEVGGRKTQKIEIPNEPGMRGTTAKPETGPVTESDSALALQLLPEPRPIHVRTRVRRDHDLPVSIREDSRWRGITAAGPHRVSCGHEEERAEAREYFRCVSDEGELLWIYRDAVEGTWYLHGWWD
jgi:protein ImuB